MRIYNELSVQILNATADGTFVTVKIDELAKSMGHTLGNALRRVLLNEVSGPGVKAFCIQNVTGLAQKIPSVIETTDEIAFNLKKFWLRNKGNDTTPVVLRASNNNKDKIVFGDFKVLNKDSQNYSITNPEEVLLNLGIEAVDGK